MHEIPEYSTKPFEEPLQPIEAEPVSTVIDQAEPLSHDVPRQECSWALSLPGVNKLIAASMNTVATARSAASNTDIVGRAFVTDVRTKSLKEGGAALASLGGIAATTAIGALRLPTILGITLPLSIYNHTGFPPAAGLATALAYGGWCWADAAVFNSGIDHLPRTFSAISKAIPTDKFNRILPGLEPLPEKPESQTIQLEATRAQRLGHAAVSLTKTTYEQVPANLSRGATIQAAGIMAYVLAAGAQNQTRKQRRELSGRLGVAGAFFMGSLATAMTTALYAVGKQDKDLAAQFSHFVDNKWLCLGAAWIGIPAIQLTIQKAINPAIRHIGQTYKKWRADKQRLDLKITPEIEEPAV